MPVPAVVDTTSGLGETPVPFSVTPGPPNGGKTHLIPPVDQFFVAQPVELLRQAEDGAAVRTQGAPADRVDDARFGNHLRVVPVGALRDVGARDEQGGPLFRAPPTRCTQRPNRVVRIDECETLINPQSPVVESCSSAEIPSVFSYEATGERSSIFDAVASGAADFSDYGEHVLHFEYDTLGRVVATHDPDKDGIVTTTYDVRGRIHEVVNARSQKRTYFYDRLGRMTYVGTPSEEADVTIGYRRNQKQQERQLSHR